MSGPLLLSASPRRPRVVPTLAAVAVLGASACSPTSPDALESWNSDQASLTIDGDVATLLILASEGCYGSYGTIEGPLPSGPFDLPGTYTQLTGVAPGMIENAARFSGTRGDQQISLTVSLPTSSAVIGSFTLARGVSEDWSACLYP